MGFIERKIENLQTLISYSKILAIHPSSHMCKKTLDVLLPKKKKYKNGLRILESSLKNVESDGKKAFFNFFVEF